MRDGRRRTGTDGDGRGWRRALALLLAAFALSVPVRLCPSLSAQSREVLLATTTSTRDAGLLEALLPIFERQTGYTVKVIAVGSGQALELGRRGDADVVLSHAPEQERALADSGYFLRRRLVMHNDFLVVGPADDPAGLRGMNEALAAFRRVAQGEARFVSRGDRSGTHQLERALWRRIGIQPPRPGGWYVESGQGMGETLQIADETRAYTLTDRATYLVWRDKVHLVPMVEGDSLLYNVYHVMEVNPRNAPRVNAAGARALADFLEDPDTQRRIGEFGKDRFGQSLFVPDAGKPQRSPGDRRSHIIRPWPSHVARSRSCCSSGSGPPEAGCRCVSHRSPSSRRRVRCTGADGDGRRRTGTDRDTHTLSSTCPATPAIRTPAPPAASSPAPAPPRASRLRLQSPPRSIRWRPL